MEETISYVIETLKSQGLFDRIRKKVLSDIQNTNNYDELMQNADQCIELFLQEQSWPSATDKLQLREDLRFKITHDKALNKKLDQTVDNAISTQKKDDYICQINKVVCQHLKVDYDKWLRDSNEFVNSKQLTAQEVPVAPDSDVEMDIDSEDDGYQQANHSATIHQSSENFDSQRSTMRKQDSTQHTRNSSNEVSLSPTKHRSENNTKLYYSLKDKNDKYSRRENRYNRSNYDYRDRQYGDSRDRDRNRRHDYDNYQRSYDRNRDRYDDRRDRTQTKDYGSNRYRHGYNSHEPRSSHRNTNQSHIPHDRSLSNESNSSNSVDPRRNSPSARRNSNRQHSPFSSHSQTQGYSQSSVQVKRRKDIEDRLKALDIVENQISNPIPKPVEEDAYDPAFL
ncbi:RNA-splicing factor [Cichlidogyrus casuarinus]|uniref:RNA-splicing factor n=1 Tax=Cichlidogyrus casuarinus TaxID=1844966 RepID=A0ABD2QMD4_9PLAT